MVKSSQDMEMVSPLEKTKFLVESHAYDGNAEEAVTNIQQQDIAAGLHKFGGLGSDSRQCGC